MEVSLITEGTYPFHEGGVSVWCDQLLRGMPRHRFRIDAITVTGLERGVWELPDNVGLVRQVPLWGPASIGRIGRRRDRRAEPIIGSFLMSITDPKIPSETFEAHLCQLRGVARAGGLSASLLTERAVREMLRAMAVDGLENRTLAEAPATPTVADAVASLKVLEHLLRPLAAPPPVVDVCHATSNGAAALVAMGAKWSHGTPFLLTEHGIYLRERYIGYGPRSMPHPQRSFMLSFFRRLTETAYRMADVIAPGSEYNRLWEWANGAIPNKIIPIYNGIDVANFAPPTSEPDVPTLSWVGRIDPLKDVKTLLRAFAKVREARPEARLRIFGGTPKGNEGYLRECLALRERLGLGEAAVFEGRVPDVMDAYHAGHAVVATSISEGFPYAVIEAMASGRALVATDVGGVREAVADAGILVAPRDDVAIADACLRLLADPVHRQQLALAARARVLSMFTLETCLDRYEALYDQLGRRMPGTGATDPGLAADAVIADAAASTDRSSDFAPLEKTA